MEEPQFFYRCRRYDSLTKSCKVYSIRPNTCKNFPWYDYGVFEQPLYSKNCAFQKDIKKLKRKKADDTRKSDSISSGRS
jgi:Fe-S-cluster containining protein